MSNEDRWLATLEAQYYAAMDEAQADEDRFERMTDEYGRSRLHPDHGYRGPTIDLCRDCGWVGDAWMLTGDSRMCPQCKGWSCDLRAEVSDGQGKG